MNHDEYIRISREKHTAVLMIHGILGTPRHFDELIPLVPENFSIYNILLDGHGHSVTDFSGTSMKQWRTQVSSLVDELCAEYDQIIIIAHSMGTLFALEAAIAHPTQIRCLILLATPLKLSVKPSIFVNALKVAFSCVSPGDPVALATQKAYSLAPDKRIWLYVGWIPRYLELFATIREIRQKIPAVDVPVYTFQSRRDELVSVKAVDCFASNTRFCNYFLESSHHFYYESADLACLQARIAKILNQTN